MEVQTRAICTEPEWLYIYTVTWFFKATVRNGGLAVQANSNASVGGHLDGATVQTFLSHLQKDQKPKHHARKMNQNGLSIMVLHYP